MSEPIMTHSPKEVELNESGKEAANKIVQGINKQKWTIIKQLLKQESKMNLIKDLDKQRFKKIMIEMHPDKEVVYYDNKTLKGKRLVTFLNPMEPTIEGDSFKTKLLYF